jgi:hypothetical protein
MRRADESARNATMGALGEWTALCPNRSRSGSAVEFDLRGAVGLGGEFCSGTSPAPGVAAQSTISGPEPSSHRRRGDDSPVASGSQAPNRSDRRPPGDGATHGARNRRRSGDASPGKGHVEHGSIHPCAGLAHKDESLRELVRPLSRVTRLRPSLVKVVARVARIREGFRRCVRGRHIGDGAEGPRRTQPLRRPPTGLAQPRARSPPARAIDCAR